MSIESKAARIKLVLFDVDGVLTDGTVEVNGDGTESKRFCIRDGIAMVWAEREGLKVGLLSARFSSTTTYRASQLGLSVVRQGVANKLDAYDEIIADLKLADADVAYMGDDVVDLAVLGRVGLSTAPSDAVPEVRRCVQWVAPAAGGAGAARALIEVILRAQNRWDALVASFSAQRHPAPKVDQG